MKKHYPLIFSVLVIVVAWYFVDREVWMQRRVTAKKVWEFESGDLYSKDNVPTRGLLYTDKITYFKNDTIVFTVNYGETYVQDTLILKWLYFGKLKVEDPKTGKTGVYVKFDKI